MVLADAQLVELENLHIVTGDIPSMPSSANAAGRHFSIYVVHVQLSEFMCVLLWKTLSTRS